MTKYIIRRLVHFPLTLLGSLAITFVLVRLLPGEPFFISEKTTREFIERNNRLQGLDLPLPIQFWNFLWHVGRLDFGNSFFSKRPVINLVWEHFTISLLLIALALVFMLVVGLSAGLYAASKQGTWVAHIFNNVANFFASIPTFVLAALALAVNRLLVLTYRLYESPIGGWGAPEKGIPPNALQILIPAFILAVRPTAMLMRMAYTEIVDVKNHDYVRTAYSKGLANATVTRRYIFRNSLIPVNSFAGSLLVGMLVGVAEVEYIMRVPGLGSYLISSIVNLDYPVVVGITCFYTLLVAGVNLIIDLLYVVIDPRISYTQPAN